MPGKIIIITHGLIIQYLIFHKHFQRINGRKDNHSFIRSTKIHKYTADSCTTLEESIIEAATKKRLFWIGEHYFAKFQETSHNGCFQDNGQK